MVLSLDSQVLESMALYPINCTEKSITSGMPSTILHPSYPNIEPVHSGEGATPSIMVGNRCGVQFVDDNNTNYYRPLPGLGFLLFYSIPCEVTPDFALYKSRPYPRYTSTCLLTIAMC